MVLGKKKKKKKTRILSAPSVRRPTGKMPGMPDYQSSPAWNQINTINKREKLGHGEHMGRKHTQMVHGDGEPMSQGDGEDPEGQGAADGSGDQCRGGDPEGHGGAGATEDQGGAEGKEEPDGAGGTERTGAAGGVGSQGDGWSTTDQGGARGMREPGGASGLMGHGGEEGARSHGGAAGSTGRGGVRGLVDSPATVTMEDGRPAELAPYKWWAEGEQRGCHTTAVEEAGEAQTLAKTLYNRNE